MIGRFLHAPPRAMHSPKPKAPATRFRFGACILDPARRELLCDDAHRPLSARVFTCLHHLIAHRDRAVGRDELVRAVFGRPDVSDAQLAQVVLRARRALGDDGQAQRVIRTVPSYGFRWAADVVVEVPVARAQATPRGWEIAGAWEEQR